MAGNEVRVRITGNDEISGIIRNIKGNFGSIGGIVSGVTASLAGMAVAAVGVMQLTKGIGEASKLQTTLVTGAGDVATLMGTSYSDALSVVKGVQAEISKMAAALPGETAGYSAIANGISASVALGAKGDIKKYKTDLLDLTKTIGLLAATKGVDMNQAASAANKLVAGTANLSELFATNDVFQKNPLFRIYLQEQLRLIGKQEKDWKTLSQDVRDKAITMAGAKAFSPEMLANLSLTTESMFQAMKSNMFDPQTGMFGWSREFSNGFGSDGKAQVKSAMDSVGRFLGEINKLGVSTAKYATKLGISFDPMRLISDVIDTMSVSLTVVRNTIDQGGDVWHNLTRDFIGSVSSALTFIAKSIDSIDWGKLGTNFGESLGTILTSKELGVALEKALVSSVNGLASAIQGAFDGAIAEVNKGFIKPAEDNANKALGEATGGMFGTTKDGSTNGWSKIMKQQNKDTNASPVGQAWKFFTGSELYPEASKPLPSVTSPQSSLPSLGQMGNKSTSSTFAPVIQLTASAGSDGQQTADYILSELNKQFLQYRDTVLT